MRVVFMGSPDFALPALQALINSTHQVAAVYSQPPRKAGRGHKVQPTPVHALAERHGIAVHTPEKLTPEQVEVVKNLKPDIICVAAYGLLLPQAVLDIAPCLNIHPSALPRWRGAAPLHYTVLNGDTTTAVCIMHMEAGLDSGPVYLRETSSVLPNETTGDLHDRLSRRGADLLLEVLDNWGKYQPQPQDETIPTTYAHKLKPAQLKEIRAINWALAAQDVLRHIHGLSPWPGAQTLHESTPLTLLRAEVIPQQGTATPGTVLCADTKTGLVIACAESAVQILELQRPGKKPMPATDFLRGYPQLQVGNFLT